MSLTVVEIWERAAISAMQAILASGTDAMHSEIARDAVEQADALIEAMGYALDEAHPHVAGGAS